MATALWTPANSAHANFKTGLIPTPRHKLAAMVPFQPLVMRAPRPIVVPSKLSYWLNNQYGDCHDEQTEVLTEYGWKHWQDYDGESLLATVNPLTLLLEFQAPSNVVRREHNGPMMYGTHKGQDFAITPNHRLLMRPYKIVTRDGKYVPGASGYCGLEFRKASDAPARFLIPGAPSGFLGTRLDKLTIGNRQWDGTDFLRLLSLIISDGYASSGATHPERSSFCCFREDRLDMVRAFAYKMGFREEKSRPGVWTIEDVALNRWLQSNIYVGNEHRSGFKKVPELVKVSSQDQIEEFLRFYGDQGFSNGRDFYTSSSYLADDLQELLMRTGKRANIAEREARSGGINSAGKRVEGKHPSFQLHVWEDSDIGMLGPNNKKATVAIEQYKGEVFCATVPNSTLVTRRNGSVFISGNCVSAEEAAAIAMYSVMLGMPEVFIEDDTVLAFAKKYNLLNGADLSDVMDKMKADGFHQGGQTYNDGNYAAVDFSNEALLQAALDNGPVKLGMASGALPSGAGNQSGWYAIQAKPDRNEDHCTGLFNYGTAQALFASLNMPVPSGVNFPPICYHFYTWSTIGIVSHEWIMGCVGESFLRLPTDTNSAFVQTLPPWVTSAA